jgi:hypothetical protein
MLWQILVTLLHAGPQFLPGDLQDSVVMEAVKHDHLSVIRALYEAGWRPGSVKAGMHLVDRAMDYQRPQILEYFILTVGGTPDGRISFEAQVGKSAPLHSVCLLHSLEALALFIWAGADADAMDPLGITPLAFALHGAARQPQLKCRYLRYCGADPTRVCLSPEQRTRLGVARSMINPVRFEPSYRDTH